MPGFYIHRLQIGDGDGRFTFRYTSIPHLLEIPMLQLIARAESFPNRIAIQSNGKSYTYHDLTRASKGIAGYLLGSQEDLREKCIAFMVDPSFEYTACQWGIWQAGGIAVPLCVLHPLPSLRYVLEDTQAKILIVGDNYVEKLKGLADELNICLVPYSTIRPANPRVLPTLSPERAAMILYTSGTTSKPKGVVSTHGNIEFQISTLVKAWAWEKDDVILNILPLHHVHGIINVMSCALWSGACCIFLPKFDAKKVWNIFLSGQLSLFMAVPTIYFKLIDYWNKADKASQNQLSESCKDFRLMVSGSAALPESVLQTWESISGQRLLERYGMTEIGMALSNPYDGERRAGHVGQPLPGVKIRLVDESGEKVAKGEQGEIQVKGAAVFKEYWQKAEATQKAFTEDGWFQTGDMSIFQDGYYKILGRNSVDIIKSGGYKISALEIESVMLRYPGIKACAVVGIPNEEWGEVVAASIVKESEIDTVKLSTWLKNELPGYKIPRKFAFQDDLPRNTLGKVTKNEVKKLWTS